MSQNNFFWLDISTPIYMRGEEDTCLLKNTHKYSVALGEKKWKCT